MTYKNNRLATQIILTHGSSHPEVFCKKAVLKTFAKFTGKHLCQSLFFNKVTGCDLQLCLKRDSGTDVFLWILRHFATYFYMFQFLCMFNFLWKVIYFMENYIKLHYGLDLEYGNQSLLTEVFVNNYAN